MDRAGITRQSMKHTAWQTGQNYGLLSLADDRIVEHDQEMLQSPNCLLGCNLQRVVRAQLSRKITAKLED